MSRCDTEVHDLVLGKKAVLVVSSVSTNKDTQAPHEHRGDVIHVFADCRGL